MEGGPPTFRQDGSCPALLKDLCSGFPYGAVTRSGPPFQTLPVPKTQATGLVRFRSPLLAESRLMSFPPATEMFQFAGFASHPMDSAGIPLARWVAPFGDPGINDRSHLPRAFRSVPRPSSPLSAKASTRCPYFALERHTQRQGHQISENQISEDQNRRAANSPLRRHFTRDPSPPQPFRPGPPRSPATVTQLASLRLSISRMPRPPHRGCRKANLGSSRRVAAQEPVGSDIRPPSALIGVEVIGIEPTTPCLQSRCSPS